MSEIRSIGILGSGVCGLAAAYRFLQLDPNLRVTLFDSEDHPGGLARTLAFDGLRADLGPHRIHTELAGILDFVRDLAGPELFEVRRSSRMWLADRWVRYPPRPLEMLRVLGPFRLTDFVLSNIAARLTPRPAPDEETFQSLMERAFGKKLYRFLVEPYTRKVWKTPPERLHGDVARVRVSAGGLGQLLKQTLGGGRKTGSAAALPSYLYLHGGIGRLAERLAEEVRHRGGVIELDRTIVGLEPRNAVVPKRPGAGHDSRGSDGWCVMHRRTPVAPVRRTAQSVQQEKLDGRPAPGDDPRADAFDFVLSTIPVTDLLDMLEPGPRKPGPLAEALGNLRYLANILVFLELNHPLDFPDQWLYFPHDDTVFNRGYLPGNFDPGLGLPNRMLLCLEVTCLPGDDLWNQGDDRIVARVREDAARIGLAPKEAVANAHVVRIPYTYPLYDTSYRRDTDRLWDFLREQPRLLSSGRQGLFLHNNVDHSIFTGLRAAEAALENPDRPGPAWYARIREFQNFRIVD